MTVSPAPFDLIVADTWAGKFHHLDEALAPLAPGGLYVVDDLLPQPDWTADHAAAVDRLVARIRKDSTLVTVRMEWASGLLLAARR